MAGYFGTRAVLLSTTAADVTGDMTVAGDATVSGAFTSLGIDDNATSTAITIDASENVGIGTSSPTAKLDVVGGMTVQQAADIKWQNTARTTTYGGISSNASELSFAWNDATAMTIDSSGNVGIGTAAPTLPLHVYNGSSATLASFESGNATSRIIIKNGTATYGSYLMDVGDALTLATNAVERLRINSSGHVLMGGTAASNSTSMIYLRPASSSGFIHSGGNALTVGRNTNDGAVVAFLREGTTVGSISVTTSATAYNTSSDYRLKENVTPIQGAADTVMSMQPCTYTAIADGVWYDGFLAHELQEVHPRAVQGTKDAMMDEEYEIAPATETEEAVMGTRSVPDMQSVDYSKLTPILTAALQEALTEIAALKVRVAALEVTQ